MRIIYMHHAERDIGPNHTDPILRQEEDITKLGVEQVELLSKKMSKLNLTAIVTSPYLRCKHTAEIINKYHNVPIIEDERFNESEYHEERVHFLKRNMEAIDDIYNKYNEDDVILCVTSGINLTAFVCYFYDIEPKNGTPLSQAADISPINFTKGKASLD